MDGKENDASSPLMLIDNSSSPPPSLILSCPSSSSGSSVSSELFPEERKRSYSSSVFSLIDRIRALLLSATFNVVGGTKVDDEVVETDEELCKKQISTRQKSIAAGTVSVLLAVAFAWWRRRLRNHEKTQDRIIPTGGFLANALHTATAAVLLGSPSITLAQRNPTRQPVMHDLNGYKRATEAPLSHLLTAAKKGLVLRALINGSTVAYQLLSPTTAAASLSPQWRKYFIPSNIPSITSDIVAALSEGGCRDISALPEAPLARIAPVLIAISPFVYLVFLYRMMKRIQKGNNSSDDINVTTSDDVGLSSTTFADVAGVDDAKSELSEIVSYLSNPAPFFGLGASPPKGVLLYGPPGNGKTLLARALAGEARADYFVSCKGSDFVEIYVGQGAKRVRDLFSMVRKEALRRYTIQRGGHTFFGKQLAMFRRNTGGENQNFVKTANSRPPTAVIFIDEIDTLAKCRDGIGRGVFFGGSGGNDEREQTLNALLTEMDGFDTPHQHSSQRHDSTERYNESSVTIIVVAATNRPSILDPALLRPGRFDRHVQVSFPDAGGRKAILQVHTRHVKLDSADVNMDALSTEENTGNFSGADLRNVVNEAALLAVRSGSSFVLQEHLLEAAQRVRRINK